MSNQPGRLLIVDDNKVNRLLLSRSAEMLGHSVTLAENGRAAMERLAEDAFDLVLLDIEMPVMDGFEVLEQVKANAELRDIPIIVTSSVDGVENIVRCIELGAEDYLPKPVNKTLLRARLTSSLEKKRLRDEQRVLLDRFATSEVARDLREQGFAIGGRRIDATVLFCDIRGFTTLSEDQPPEVTIELLNAYYTLMFDAITSNDGLVNLMIGDGLMALFGAPRAIDNPAQSALDAASDMLALIEGFNEERLAEGALPLRIGIGIASGEMVAGYAGTQDRASYTCIGSTVNRASRLESETKTQDCAILLDEATRNALVCKPDLTAVDDLHLRGFSGAITVFALK